MKNLFLFIAVFFLFTSSVSVVSASKQEALPQTQEYDNSKYAISNSDIILAVYPTIIDGKKYNMVYVTTPLNKEGKYQVAGRKDVLVVNLVPDDIKPLKKGQIAPQHRIVSRLIYHTPEGKEPFCSFMIRHAIPGSKEEKEAGFDFIGSNVHQAVVPDETAQLIVDLLAGLTQFENRTTIKFSETNSPDINPDSIDYNYFYKTMRLNNK